MDSNADVFFTTGKTHGICQDYGRAGKTKEGLSYVVVCDGCSSSPDTDFGARLLAVAAETQMKHGVLPDVSRTTEMLRCNIDWLGLAPHCFDATMVAALQEPGRVRVRMWGDGVVAAQRRDGPLEVHVVEHANNAPMYLSYFLDEKRRAGHLAKYGAQHKISSCLVPATAVSDPKWEVLCGAPPPEDWVFEDHVYSMVAVMSDGVSSFSCLTETSTSRQLQTIPVVEILRELVAFRTTRGAFVQRRCQKFLTKACVPRFWQHADDLAVGAIWMDAP